MRTGITKWTATWTTLVSLSAVVLPAGLLLRSEEEGVKPEKPEAAPRPSREELEQRFKETLTDVTLVGRWRLVREGKLGEEKEDRYTIKAVTKVGELWFITARIEYGDRDVTLPVPVRVEWAGDTPVITIDDAGIPGIGTYTARVVIHGGLYSGTWFGKGYGGLMSGVIVKNEPGSGGE